VQQYQTSTEDTTKHFLNHFPLIVFHNKASF